MCTYIKQFLITYEYSSMFSEEILQTYKKIQREEVEFESLINLYKDENSNLQDIIKKAKGYFEKIGAHEYTGYLVLFICLSKKLKQIYVSHHISLDIFDSSILDLRYETEQCFILHNVVGICFPDWIAGWFTLKKVGFKKLQFNVYPFCEDFENPFHLKKDTRVVWVHIPRTGGKLDRQTCLEDYKNANEYFKKQFGLKEVIFVCETWLLFPRHKEVLSKNSNLMQFANDFTIIKSGYYKDYSSAWRLFDTKETDIDKLPTDTSLRRFYVDLMKKGEPIGWGLGAFVYKE